MQYHGSHPLGIMGPVRISMRILILCEFRIREIVSFQSITGTQAEVSVVDVVIADVLGGFGKAVPT